MLSFLGSVSQFTALVEIDGALEGMMRLALVQSDLGAPAHVGVRGPVDHEQRAFDAADSSFWRGYEASLRRIWLGRMVPAAMVAATRRMSVQFLSIRFAFTLPATSGPRCFGTPVPANT